jgi:hypothetical protein
MEQIFMSKGIRTYNYTVGYIIIHSEQKLKIQEQNYRICVKNIDEL